MALRINRVLITDEVDSKCVEILRSSGIEVVMNTSLAKNKELLLQEIQVRNYKPFLVAFQSFRCRLFGNYFATI